MAGHDIVVVGASAGGIEALRAVVAGLPHDFPAAMFVVVHISADSPGLLPKILERAGPLPARHPDDGDDVEPGWIYVAPPDQHLLLEPGRVKLTRGPKENRFRPAIDPLFRSAATAYGDRVVGVVLSGALDDGTAGMKAIKDRGGLAVVQDPWDALVPSMPRSVLKHLHVDHVLTAEAIGGLLARLAAQPAAATVEEASMSRGLSIETRIAMEDNALEAGVMDLGPLSSYTCPECHGTLVQINDGSILRFRCHTGHAYSVNSLMAEVAGSIEESLWSALRVIEEQVMLLRHVADHSRAKDEVDVTEQLLSHARDAEQQAQLVRNIALHHRQQRGTLPAEGGDTR